MDGEREGGRERERDGYVHVFVARMQPYAVVRSVKQPLLRVAFALMLECEVTRNTVGKARWTWSREDQN